MRPPPSQPSPTWTAIKLLASDILVLLAIFAGLELAIRLIAPQQLQRTLRNVFEVRENSGFGYKPGSRATCNIGFGNQEIAINSWGCRDHEHGPKAPGEWRILCVGDSFVDNIALSVDQIYPHVLADNLRSSRPDRKITVVSAGERGWGLWEYYHYLLKEAERIKPDVVIIGFNPSDDSITSLEPPHTRRFRIAFGLPAYADTGKCQRIKWTVSALSKMLPDYSHAAVLLHRRLLFPLSWWLGLNSSRLGSLVTDPAQPDRISGPTTELLRRIKSLCQQRGAALAILAVPTEAEVVASVARLRIQLERPDVSKVDLDRPSRFLAEITAGLGIPLYHPLADLRTSKEPTYFPVFRHWNVNANRIVAEGLGQLLQKENLLGP